MQTNARGSSKFIQLASTPQVTALDLSLASMKGILLVLVYGAYFLIPSAQFDLERCGSSVSVGTKRIIYYQIVNESVSLSSAPDYASDPIEPIIRWYRDGRLIAANKRLITFVAESGLNGSVYRFTVSEFQGDVIFESEDVVLIIGEIPRLELLSGRRLSFRETSNDTLKIRLDVSGVPLPRLRVVRPQNRSHVVSSAKFEIRSNAIHVRGLSLEDWGDYEVIASSCLGNVMINISITILGGVDQTNLTDTTKAILCSKNVEFTCTAVAYPKPSIEWVWNDTLLFDGRYGITEESAMAPDGHRRKITSTLKITGVEREDNERGLIRCKSNNGIEETSIGFRLSVLCTPSACSVRFVQSELTNNSVVANIEYPTDNGGFSVNHLRVLVYALVEEQSLLISNNTYGPDQEFIKLKNLSSSSTIQFFCQANNALGYGEIGKFDVKTLGEPQSIVHINVSQSNCTSATLQFFSDRAGGIINDQQISRYEFLYGLAADGTQNGDNGTFAMTSATKDTSSCPVTTLFNLERNAKYAAVVRELNVYGAGAFSDPVLFETLCVSDADITLVVLIGSALVVLIGAVMVIVFLIYKCFKRKRIKRLEVEAKRRTKNLIETHFCQSPPTILLLGRPGNGKTSLVNTFDFVINLFANDEATCRNYDVGAGDESHTETLIAYRNLYSDYYNSNEAEEAGEEAGDRRGPTFLDSRGLPPQVDLVRPLVMMLALGYICLGTNLRKVSDDFLEAAPNAGEGGEPFLNDEILQLLFPEETSQSKGQLRLKRNVDEKVKFHKDNRASGTTQTKPHIVLLVWSAKYTTRNQLYTQLQAISTALRAARCLEGRRVGGDLNFYLVFTFGDAVKKKEKEKLEKKVVDHLPSLEKKVFFVSNCIAGQNFDVEHRLEVIRVLEVILGGYKPHEDDDITKLRRAFGEISDEIDAPEEQQNTAHFLRVLGNVLRVASLSLVQHKLSRVIASEYGSDV